MASSIDPTKPVYRRPTTASVRANFAAAKGEIEQLCGYDLPFYYSGTPAPGELIAPILVVRPILVPAGFEGSLGKVSAPFPPQPCVFPVVFAGSAASGSILVGADGAVTFDLAEAVGLSPGDEIQVYSPADAPSGVHGLRATLVAAALLEPPA
jgi:hypothetical protein